MRKGKSSSTTYLSGMVSPTFNHKILHGFAIPVFLSLFFAANGCIMLDRFLKFGAANELKVELTYHEKAYRELFLLEDAGLKATVLPRADVPFSNNASGTVWIGEEFPYNKALEVIRISLNYYPELRYVAFMDMQKGDQSDRKRIIQIAAPTEEALAVGLTAFSPKDLSRLLEVKSEDAFKAAILSRYPQKNGNVSANSKSNVK